MKTKQMMFNSPATLHALLQHLADQLVYYASYQIQSGAQVNTYLINALPQTLGRLTRYRDQVSSSLA